MPRRKPDVFEPLGTIWEIPEPAWERVEPILQKLYPPKPVGRPHVDFRAALNGVIYRMRTGCQCNHLPREFGDDPHAPAIASEGHNSHAPQRSRLWRYRARATLGQPSLRNVNHEPRRIGEAHGLEHGWLTGRDLDHGLVAPRPHRDLL